MVAMMVAKFSLVEELEEKGGESEEVVVGDTKDGEAPTTNAEELI